MFLGGRVGDCLFDNVSFSLNSEFMEVLMKGLV